MIKRCPPQQQKTRRRRRWKSGGETVSINYSVFTLVGEISVSLIRNALQVHFHNPIWNWTGCTVAQRASDNSREKRRRSVDMTWQFDWMPVIAIDTLSLRGRLNARWLPSSSSSWLDRLRGCTWSAGELLQCNRCRRSACQRPCCWRFMENKHSITMSLLVIGRRISDAIASKGN